MQEPFFGKRLVLNVNDAIPVAYEFLVTTKLTFQNNASELFWNNNGFKDNSGV